MRLTRSRSAYYSLSACRPRPLPPRQRWSRWRRNSSQPRSSSANRSSAPSSPQPPPLRRLQIAWRPISSLQGITHVACRGVYIYRIQYIHPSSPAVYNLVLPLVTMAAHIPREYPRTLSWTAGGCACAIREPPHSNPRLRSAHSAHTPLSPGHAPRSEHGRAREVYAATQPSGHSAPTDPKSSWRRWRALTETQPAGQLLIGTGSQSIMLPSGTQT